MSTYTSEPGTRLAGRYRLVDQVNEGAGWTYWKATDEALARFVSVLTFANGFPRIAETVTAARAVSRLGDPRFAQVFDVEDGEEQAYVVLEWVAAASLLDMLSEGPLDPPRAAALAVEAARAMAAAHAIGLAHRRLDPASLHWTAAGGVKIAGLGIDAALAGPVPTEPGTGAEDPQLTDTRDLARLLYAALTGYWPALPGSAGAAGPAPGLLPPAPENGGAPCTPRQVSADIPAGIDDVTGRTLFQRASRHGPALSTVTEFADALAEAAPPVPMLLSPATPVSPTLATGYPRDRSTNPYPPPEAAPRSRPAGRPGNGRPGGPGGGPKPPSQHSAAAKAIVSVVVALVLVAAGVAVWSLTRHTHTSAIPTPSRSTSSSPSTAAAAVPLKPVAASVYNTAPNSSGDDDPSGTSAAIDSDTGTFWHTSFYRGNPVFGGLKPGAGLLLDMGHPVRLSQLTIQFGTTCCTHVQIELGNTSTVSEAARGTFTPVQTSASAANSTTFNVTSKATGRYVLIWITSLPPLASQPGSYETMIYNVTVRGFTTGQPG
ncbi:MAG TPA: protein kinase family protein [Streptosporangiaceae bacterium]|nr:protein kinase family protein [Streptosporangiaceae bacterium]